VVVDDEPPSPSKRPRTRNLVQPTKASPLDREVAYRGLSPPKDPFRPYESSEEIMAEFAKSNAKSHYFAPPSIKQMLTGPRPVELAFVVLPEGQTKTDMKMFVEDDVLILVSTRDKREIRQLQVGEIQVLPKAPVFSD
jgi:hypothetical protein